MSTIKQIEMVSFLIALCFISCKKETSNPTSTTLGVKIQATNKSFSLLKSSLVTTAGYTWDTCFMVVSKIEFEAEKHENMMSMDSSSVHFEWNGPKKVDLFSLTSVIGDINLLPGAYNEISLKIKSFKIDAGSSPVFYLSGTYTNSAGSLIPIAVIVSDDFEFEVKNEGSMLDVTSDYTSLINFNLTLLMSGILKSDLDSATLTNGKIIISSTSNPLLFSKINTNISKCGASDFKKGKASDTGNGGDNGNNNGNGNGNGYDPGYNY
jgi:hypothetical protein